MDTITLVLTVKIEFAPNGVDAEYLKASMLQHAYSGFSNGAFTGDTPAEIESWSSSVAQQGVPT